MADRNPEVAHGNVLDIASLEISNDHALLSYLRRLAYVLR